MAILYAIVIFILKSKLNKRKKLVRAKKLEFSPMISEFLFYEETNKKEVKRNYLHLKIEIRELIKNKFDKEVLIEILLDLTKDLTGQSKEGLLNLYQDLDLQESAFNNLSSRKWQLIAKGIKELTLMHFVDGYNTIAKFINHRNATVRKQAEIAIISLKKEGVVYFLDNTKHKISEWQQLKILDILRHKNDYHPPKFSLWLTSTNTHVVLFALRLIKHFQQNDAQLAITTLLKHKDKRIKIEAINCIKEFYMTNALATLKLIYWKSKVDVKIAILETIGEIGDAKDLVFLELLKTKEKSFNIKSKVLGMLNKINPESNLPTQNIQDLGYFDTVDDDELVHQSSHSLEANKEAVLVENIDTTAKEIVIDEEIIDNHELNFSLEVASSSVIIAQDNLNNDIKDKPIENEVTHENTNIKQLNLAQNSLVFEPIFELNEVEFEELNNNDKIKDSSILRIEDDFQNIDWSFLINQNIIPSNTRQSSAEPVANSNPDHYSILIDNKPLSFSANFLSDSELETIVLLEDIAIMGDLRELPLLYQLLEEETSTFILERVEELIKKFKKQGDSQINANRNQEQDHIIIDSVFTDLLQLADVETKVFLVKEMAKIGSEKEVILLKSLVKQNNNVIAKHAKKSLKMMLSKTEQNNTSKIENNAETAVPNSKKITSNQEGNTLFDHLCSFSNNIYDKING